MNIKVGFSFQLDIVSYRIIHVSLQFSDIVIRDRFLMILHCATSDTRVKYTLFTHTNLH